MGKKMTPPTTPLPESSHLERLSSGGNLLTSGWMNPTRPPLLTTREHPLGIPSSGEDFKLMKNVLPEAGAQDLAMRVGNACETAGWKRL